METDVFYEPVTEKPKVLPEKALRSIPKTKKDEKILPLEDLTRIFGLKRVKMLGF